MTSGPESVDLPRLRLAAPIRPSDSGSAAFLGLASDGREYWVKVPNNPQGSRTLAVEAICYGIGRLLGAPVCGNALIEIPNDMNWQYRAGYRLHGGVGHGSLNVENVVVSDEWETYSGRDDNRSRQALICALWDLCMGVDPQWLHQVTSDYSIWSFDHGLWPAGEADWSVDGLRAVGVKPWQYDLDPAVASAEGLRVAADRVQALTSDAIRAVTDTVPLAWDVPSDEVAAVADILFVRTEGVAERLREAAERSGHA